MFRDSAREEVLAILQDFSDRLTLPPDFAVRAGSTCNDAFLLRAYARGERNDGTEVAITVDVKFQEGVLEIESDICRDGGHVYKEGPSLSMAVKDDRQALELFEQWLGRLREYLQAHEQFFVALLRE